MKKAFHLSFDQVGRLTRKFGSPLLVLSLRQAEENYRCLERQLGRVKLHYAMKSNPAVPLLRLFAGMGAGFDVASIGEIRALAALGVPPECIIYANPTKPEASLIEARQLGVTRYTFDSPSEIEKMSRLVPGATVWLRLRVVNPGALVNLNSKFGAAPENAIALLLEARDTGLDVAGLSFHVGSQTRDEAPYLASLATCRSIFDAACAEKLNLRSLDIGGGFPIIERGHEIDQEAMNARIRIELDRLFPEIELIAEPGRSLCGTAVNLITSVIGTQVREDRDWYLLDDGIYGSFSGILFDHWDFDLLVERDGFVSPVTFAGPSCDSLDVLFRERPMPALSIGDRILVPACGAYTSASATTFNGFPLTPMIIWEDVCNNLD